MIDNAILFDIFHARDARIQANTERAIASSEEDVYLSIHNQLGAISHRVDRAIANFEADQIKTPLPLDCFELHNPRPIEGYFLEIHINRDNDIIAWARSNEIEGPVPRQGVPMKGEI